MEKRYDDKYDDVAKFKRRFLFEYLLWGGFWLFVTVNITCFVVTSGGSTSLCTIIFVGIFILHPFHFKAFEDHDFLGTNAFYLWGLNRFAIQIDYSQPWNFEHPLLDNKFVSGWFSSLAYLELIKSVRECNWNTWNADSGNIWTYLSGVRYHKLDSPRSRKYL